MTSRGARPRSWHLYVILNRTRVLRDSKLIRIARSAIRGGADALQLRYKGARGQDTARVARQLKRVCRRLGVPFIVNDRIEAALALDADGLHISKADMSWGLARRLLGGDKILGVSASKIADIRKAKAIGADYVGCGPVFRTPIKSKKQPLRGSLIKRILKLDIPVVFVGGINLKNAPPLAKRGIRRIGVIRAVLESRDPYKAAKTLKEMITV